MKIILSTTLLLCGLLLTDIASADWVTVGAAYHCDKKQNTFTLYGTRNTSSPNMLGTILAKPSHTQLENGESEIICNMTKYKIKSKLKISPPQPSGMCMGIGYIYLQSFYINDQNIITNPNDHTFNSGCNFKPVLFKLQFDSNNSESKVELCRGKWTWENGFTNVTCAETPIR